MTFKEGDIVKCIDIEDIVAEDRLYISKGQKYTIERVHKNFTFEGDTRLSLIGVQGWWRIHRFVLAKKVKPLP